MVCISTVEYYTAMKNEVAPLETTWIDLKGIMLSKIKQILEDFNCGSPAPVQ